MDLARQIITTHQLKAVTALHFSFTGPACWKSLSTFTGSNSVSTLSEGGNSSIWTILTSLHKAACGDALINNSSSQLQDTNRITFLFFSSMTALQSLRTMYWSGWDQTSSSSPERCLRKGNYGNPHDVVVGDEWKGPRRTALDACMELIICLSGHHTGCWMNDHICKCTTSQRAVLQNWNLEPRPCNGLFSQWKLFSLGTGRPVPLSVLWYNDWSQFQLWQISQTPQLLFPVKPCQLLLCVRVLGGQNSSLFQWQWLVQKDGIGGMIHHDLTRWGWGKSCLLCNHLLIRGPFMSSNSSFFTFSCQFPQLPHLFILLGFLIFNSGDPLSCRLFLWIWICVRRILCLSGDWWFSCKSDITLRSSDWKFF